MCIYKKSSSKIDGYIIPYYNAYYQILTSLYYRFYIRQK